MNQPDDLFFYSCVIVISVWFFNTVYIPTAATVVSIVVGISVIIYLEHKRTEVSGNLNKELIYKLNTLLEGENIKRDITSVLYTEPELIIFFYEIKDLKIYNRDAYIDAIKTINNVLTIRRDIENDFRFTNSSELTSWQNFGKRLRPTRRTNIKNLPELFRIANENAVKSVNYITSFSVSIPTIFMDKHTKATKRYHLLVKRITDDIYIHAVEYKTDPLVTQDYGLPKAYKPVKSTFEFYT